MYKILIVDDQAPVRMGIRHMLETIFPRQFTLLDAADGEAGYAVAKEAQPNIILTDIMMPGVSGLEMIERLLGEASDSIFVVMSAYEEFAYARQALALGVKEYLLKPVLEKDLYLVLEKVAGDMLNREDGAYSDLVLYNYFTGSGLSSKAQSVPKFTALQGMAKRLWGVAIAEEGGIDNLDALLLLQWRLEKDIKRAGVEAISFQNHHNRAALIFGYDSAQEEAALARRLQDAAQKERGATMIGVSLGCEDPGQLRVFFRQAEHALEKAHAERVPFASFTVEKQVFGSIITQQACRAMLEAVKGQDEASVSAIMEAIFVDISRLCTSKDMARLEYEKLLFFLELHAGQMMPASDQLAATRAELQSARSMLALKAAAYAYVHETMRLLSRWKETNAELDGVMEYVERNYSRDINATVLANVANMSYSYFCSLFARKMGMTTSEYVNSVRLERARELLEEGAHAVLAISDQCGFTDYRYFSRLFKRRYGYSPTAYRRQCGV